MKRVLVITLAFISCLAAKAQLPTISPSYIYKVPNVSHATYTSVNYCDEDNRVYFDLHCNPYTWGAENAVASSTLGSQGSASYLASNVKDWNHETAWVEGVSGYGIGEWIELQNVRPDGGTITALHIINGYVKSDKAWSENSRVKRLKVYCDGKPICILDLQNSRSTQTFSIAALSNYRYIGKIRFEILEVYQGTKYQDTVISEIYFTAVP